MRNVNIPCTTTENITTTTTITKEDIISINLNKNTKELYVTINQNDKDNNLINNAFYVIQDDNYNLLMSANPAFNPNKQENQYGETDIWYIIDLIRQRNNS